jgi:hypothetical protein
MGYALFTTPASVAVSDIRRPEYRMTKIKVIGVLWRKRVGVEPTFEAREGLERQL